MSPEGTAAAIPEQPVPPRVLLSEQSWHKHPPLAVLTTVMARFSPPFPTKNASFSCDNRLNLSRSQGKGTCYCSQPLKHLVEKFLKLHLGGGHKSLVVVGSWLEEMASETLDDTITRRSWYALPDFITAILNSIISIYAKISYIK